MQSLFLSILLGYLRHVVSGASGAAIFAALLNGDWKTGIAGLLGAIASLLTSTINKTNQSQVVTTNFNK